MISSLKSLPLLRYISFAFVVVVLSLSGCTNIPAGIQPVTDFAKERYLGTWYEIARLDHPFERGLQQISATYTARDDGGVSVLNKGFNVAEQIWTEAQGKAYFVDKETTGHLKVSFFGPFYASYVIAVLDEDYQYALVTGPDTDYLWILARTPQLDPLITERLLEYAKATGFATDKMIFVDHNIRNLE